jgi:hypothetical protein
MIPAHGALKNDGSSYVPNMTHNHHVDYNGETTVEFVNTVADATALGAAVTVNAGLTVNVDYTLSEPYGRSVDLASTDAAGDVTITGFDYLNQIMTEKQTLSSSASTGKKAFKQIISLTAASDHTGAVTVKTGAQYGLPFAAVELVREVVDGVASTEGTITAAVVTTPSATTGDTRGTYNPNTAGNGAKDISVTYITTAALSGGLYGPRQA